LSATHNNGFMGTPPYAAPELYQGKVSTHTDQYALAVTYAELVSGGRVLYPPQIACRPGGVAVDFRKVRTNECAVLQRALDPHWTNRWPNCKSFVTALREALARPRNLGRKLGTRQLKALRRPAE
jgi:serine/threonine protein kinase